MLFEIRALGADQRVNLRLEAADPADAADQARLQGLTVLDAIDQYHADAGIWPPTLESLAERLYLRSVPFDPITDKQRHLADRPAAGR
jgi:hypothetical protein